MRHAVIALLLAQVAAQPAAPKPAAGPAFEVSTVKRSAPDATGGSVGIEPGGRFVGVNFPVRTMIAIGYRTSQRLFQSQIIGGPDWLASDRYDVIAKLGEDYAGKSAAQSFQSIGLLVRTLLEDRFKLRVHHEMREMPTYALLPVRKDGSFGPQFKRTTVDCAVEFAKCRIESIPGHFSAIGVTISDLVITLGGSVERVIVDRTGLSGRFDVELEWSPDQSVADKPSLFTALDEQLGLRLESVRAPVDVVVIDHVERPTED